MTKMISYSATQAAQNKNLSTLNREKKCKSHVTMVAKSLDHNNSELKQWRWWWQRERQKLKQYMYISKTTNLKCAFAHFLALLPDWDMKLPNFHTPTSWSRWTQDNNFLFLFLIYGPFRFNSRNFRQDLTKYMKLNNIDEVWNSANSLF